jgi:predicted ATPase
VYDWTYGLLQASEQAVFRRLAVLAEPLTLNEVAALLAQPGDEWALYDALAALVERSLLQLDDGDLPRYSLLESARAYAMTQLRAAGEHEFIAQASAWYERSGDDAAHGACGTRPLLTYSTALDLALALPPGAVRDQRELQLALKLGPAVQATLGPAHPRCEALYRRSVELARQRPASNEAFKAVWGYWHFLSLAGRDRDAAPYAREIVDMAPHLRDDGLQLEAWHAAMTTCDLLGDAAGVVAHARRIAGLYDSCRHHRLTFDFGGHDPGVCALGQGALNLWLTDRPDEARTMARQSLDLAATLQHGYSRATAAFYAAITYAALGDASDLRRTADALVQLSDQFDMEMLLTEGRFFQGCARYADGDRAGATQMREALARIEHDHDLAFIFVYMSFLAEALLREREFDELDALVQRALGYAASGQGLFLPELLRLRALARVQRGDARWRDDADEALRLASQQGATLLQRRVASVLASLTSA